MLKRFKDLSNVRTEVLFVQARLTHTITVLSSLLAAFMAGLLLPSMRSLESNLIFGIVVAIAFMILMGAIADLQLNKSILPELRKRCSELASHLDGTDYTVEYRKQKKWSILGSIFLLLAIILYVFLQKVGFIQPNTHSFKSEAIHLIMIITLTIPGLLFILLSIRCPACKRFIPKQYENKQGTCPHCGVKLK
jgi:hypothetical protein